MSLTELIIETGIHDAIATEAQREGQALEERHRGRDHQQRPQDDHPRPAHRPDGSTQEMSKLLDDLIKQSRADAAAYEEFLRKAEALVKRLAAKQPDAGVPAALHGKREAAVIYNNLRGASGDRRCSSIRA